MLHRLHTGIQRRAALQHDGAVPLPCQQQGCKQPCRAKSAHHRAVRKRLRTRVQGKVCAAVQGGVRTACRKRSFLPGLLQGDRHGIHQLGLAVAGIHRKLCHAGVLYLAAGHTQSVQRLFKCLRLCGRERQTDVANQNHL